MKKYIVSIFIIISILLISCTNEQTFEDYFYNKMKDMKEKKQHNEYTVNYSLIYKAMNVVHQDDAIAIFTEHNSQGKQIFIAYFEKVDGKWKWRRTRGDDWEGRQNWSFMHEPPYIYSGAISDYTISEVYVGKNKANIIDVEKGKRFWYVISNRKDAEVKFIYNDGTEKLIEMVNVNRDIDK